MNNKSFKTKQSTCNGSAQIVTHNSKSNGSVTPSCHTLRGISKKFYARALAINQRQRRPFSIDDYPEYSTSNYRQIIHRLGDLIQLVYRSNVGFYRVKGIELPNDAHSVTLGVTGVPDFESIIKSLVNQPLKIHDINIKFDSDNLHADLVASGCSVNASNHSISVHVPYPDSSLTIRCLVYPSSTHVFIGCSIKPLIYDYTGVMLLDQILSVSWCYLYGLSHCTLPNVSEWIVTRWDCNKDGTEVIDGQSFHHTWKDGSGALCQYYNKLYPNGKRLPRLETIQTLDKPMQQIMTEVKNK